LIEKTPLVLLGMDPPRFLSRQITRSHWAHRMRKTHKMKTTSLCGRNLADRLRRTSRGTGAR